MFSLLFLRFLEKPLTPPKRVPGAESGEALTEDAGLNRAMKYLVFCLAGGVLPVGNLSKSGKS